MLDEQGLVEGQQQMESMKDRVDDGNAKLVEISDTLTPIRTENGHQIYLIGGREVQIWHEEQQSQMGEYGGCFRIECKAGEEEDLNNIQYGIVVPQGVTLSEREYTLELAKERVNKINLFEANKRNAKK